MNLAKVIGIRPGELRPTSAMFCLLGLIIATSYILKPVRSSIFLTAFGADQLPYVYMLIGAVLGLVASAFSRIVARFKLHRVFTGASLFFAVNLVLFWWAIGSGWPFVPYVFYVWVSVFTVVMPTLFWLLANYVFYPNEGRRLFSTVTAGGLLGSIAGGGLTSSLVRFIGTSALLLCAAALLLVVAALATRIQRVERDRLSERFTELRRQETRARSLAKQASGTVRLILGSRYLLFLTVTTTVISVTSTLVDYQFNVVAEQSFDTMDSLTRFFGTFFAAINALAFLSQLLLAGRVLTRFGVGAGLLFLPAGLLLGSFWFLWAPSLLSAAFLKLSDDGLGNSVNKSSLEILYLPISLEVKNRAKAWMDMFVERVSRGVGGLLILLSTTLLALSVNQVSLIVLSLLVPWLVLTYLLRREYVRTFRASLARRDIDVAALTADVQDPQSLSVLRQVLTSSDEKQILYALELLRGSDDEGLVEPVERLTKHESPEIRAAAIRLLCSYAHPPSLERVSDLITDPNPLVRAEGLLLLYRMDKSRGERELHAVFRAGNVAGIHAVFDSMEATPAVLEGVLDEAFPIRYGSSNRAEERELAARSLGFIEGNGELRVMLRELLKDPSTDVARSAAASAGRLRDKSLIPDLIQQVSRRRLRAPARKALARLGDEVIAAAGILLEDESQPIELRRGLPRVLGEFDSQVAVKRLLACLPDDDLNTHYQIVKSLGKMRARDSKLKFDRLEVDRILHAEADAYSSDAARLAAIRRSRLEDDSMALLRHALAERFDFTRDRIFRLLGLIYPKDDIYNAWNAVVNGRPPVRAAALEFLGNLLSTDHRDWLLPLLEAMSPETVPDLGSRLIDRSSLKLDHVLRELITGKDIWLAACAATLVGRLQIVELAPVLERALAEETPVLKEAVEYARGRLSG
jgi:AAA family ATP:ADP antiporter